MKLIISKAMMLVATAAALLSFSSNFGGEGFEISLNGKLLLQQFGKDLNTVKTLQLNQGLPDDRLIIRYYHCGRVGKNRVVIIKDAQDKLIKEWRFNDASSAVSAMSCPVKEIMGLKKNNNAVFKLYYSSSELPNGRQLASIVTNNTLVASARK